MSCRVRFSILAILLVAIGSSQLFGHQETPPNVLLICVDDLRNCLELDGDTIARTPNLDRLAAEGRYFTHHYVQVAAWTVARQYVDRPSHHQLVGCVEHGSQTGDAAR